MNIQAAPEVLPPAALPPQELNLVDQPPPASVPTLFGTSSSTSLYRVASAVFFLPLPPLLLLASAGGARRGSIAPRGNSTASARIFYAVRVEPLLQIVTGVAVLALEHLLVGDEALEDRQSRLSSCTPREAHCCSERGGRKR